MNLMLIVAAVALVAGLALLAFSVNLRKKNQAQYDAIMLDYRPVADLKAELKDISGSYRNLQERYQEKRDALKKFENIIRTYDLGVGTIDANTYKPLFNTRDESVLEDELARVKEEAKELVKNKGACLSHLPADTAINGKKSEAKKFVNREIKLRIRCFDNEVKAAIAAVEWNNINRLIQRIKNKFDEINMDSRLVKIFLEHDYLDLKVRELRLNYEIKQLRADLKEEEREERQRVREEERDEERVRQQLEKAKRDRERMEKLVERELARINEATEGQKEQLELHQKELDLLRQKEARAISLARQTRAGYVYVISNPSSFGERVCKIGMTRRLDPNDRVKELGDASVPELFQVHAFIYTDDAPTLERYFHDHFSQHRVNLVNRRKEFFNIEPEAALKALKQYHGQYTLESFDEVSTEAPTGGKFQSAVQLKQDVYK
ncbi:DUF4041 domain-containing protein [Marinobacter sp. 71-i]|uniref:DUF4041 domain-containing protein n=1 Tax=Marinobacter iranensis TaxID=2962607 RepID=A0ABT5YGC4_9GAMM|nr:DUF4041 domain-containing protein [Marinobacter iranensis]MDF0752729.1 DUF4041 domain-containing protein [Marinobacter iranensis]